MHHRKKAATATSLWRLLRNQLGLRAHDLLLHTHLQQRTPKCFLQYIITQTEPSRDGRGNLSIETHVRIIELGMQDATQRVNHCERTPFSQGKPDGKGEKRVDGHCGIYPAQQFIDALTCQRRDKDKPALSGASNAGLNRL